MTLPSLSVHLGMDQLFSQYNSVVEAVNQHAPDSLGFHNETRRLYQEIRHLHSQVKAWTRLLSLGSIQTIPFNSVNELQIERQRINSSLRSVADQVEARRINNLLQGIGSQLVQHHYQTNQQPPARSGTGGPQFRTPAVTHSGLSRNYPQQQQGSQPRPPGSRLVLPVVNNGLGARHGHGGSVTSTSSANSSNAENHPPSHQALRSAHFTGSGFPRSSSQQNIGYFAPPAYVHSDSESSVSSAFYPGN